MLSKSELPYGLTYHIYHPVGLGPSASTHHYLIYSNWFDNEIRIVSMRGEGRSPALEKKTTYTSSVRLTRWYEDKETNSENNIAHQQKRTNMGWGRKSRTDNKRKVCAIGYYQTRKVEERRNGYVCARNSRPAINARNKNPQRTAQRKKIMKKWGLPVPLSASLNFVFTGRTLVCRVHRQCAASMCSDACPHTSS